MDSPQVTRLKKKIKDTIGIETIDNKKTYKTVKDKIPGEGNGLNILSGGKGGQSEYTRAATKALGDKVIRDTEELSPIERIEKEKEIEKEKRKKEMLNPVDVAKEVKRKILQKIVNDKVQNIRKQI